MITPESMSSRVAKYIMAIAAIIFSTTAFCMAGDPEKMFNDLFGSDAKKAWTSRNTKDAADFAVKLMESAQKVQDDPALMEYILNKACEFAMKDSSGFSTAVQAVESLRKEFPAKKDVYAEKLLGLYQTQFEKTRGTEKTAAGEEYANMLIARGDELMVPPEPSSVPASEPVGPRINADAINAAIKFYRQAQAVAGAVRSDIAAQAAQKIADANAQLDFKKRYDDLTGRFAAKPDDPATAKALTLLCLLELDDPALASKYSSAAADEAMKIYVPLAAKPIKDIQESLCMELANWYKALAGTASGQQAKINALSRCKTYLAQFVALHDKSDGEQLRAQKLLENTGAELAKLDPAGKGGTSARTVHINLPKKPGIIWEYKLEHPPFRLLLSPDCRKLAVCMNNEGYIIFDVETKKELFKCPAYEPRGELFSPDSKFFMMTGTATSIFDIKTGTVLVDNKKRADNGVDTPAFTTDGKYVYGFQLMGDSKTLDIVETETGKKVKQIPLDCKGTIKQGASVGLSPDGKLAVVTGFEDAEGSGRQRFCKIVDLVAEKPIQTLPCPQDSDGIVKAFFLADGKRVIGYGQRSGVTIWDARSGKAISEFKKPSLGFAYTPDGKRLAFGNFWYDAFSIELIDTASGKVIQTIKPERPKEGRLLLPYSACLYFTPDGQYLFCGYCQYKDRDARELQGTGVYLIGIGR